MLTKKYFLLIPSVFGYRAEEREGDINCNGFHRGVVTTLNHSNGITTNPKLRPMEPMDK